MHIEQKHSFKWDSLKFVFEYYYLLCIISLLINIILFQKEVANLMSYGLTLDHHASKAIGYREVMLRLMMKKCDANEIKKMITEIQVKTNQLAVSQLKFARNSQHLNLWRWIDVNNLSSGFEPTRPLSDLNINSVVDLIEKDYNTPLEEINTPRNLEYFSPPTHIYEVSNLF